MLLAFNEGPLVLCFTYSSLFQHNCIFIRILVACLEQRPPLDVNGYVVIWSFHVPCTPACFPPWGLKRSHQLFPTWMVHHSTLGDSDTMPYMEMEENSVDHAFKAAGCLMDSPGTWGGDGWLGSQSRTSLLLTFSLLLWDHGRWLWKRLANLAISSRISS